MASDRIRESPHKRKVSPTAGRSDADFKRSKTSTHTGNANTYKNTVEVTEDTVATIPLPVISPSQPQRVSSKHFSSTTSGPVTTQPTQILDTPIARRADPNAVIQVPASSPVANSSPFTSPTVKSRVSGIAPPGTSFRPPPRVSSASKQADYDSPVQDSSEDDRPAVKAHNKPSLAQPKPKSGSLSTFQQIMNQYQHNDGKPIAPKPAPTKSALPKRPQTSPEKIGWPGMTLNDIQDVVVQKKVKRMTTVLPSKDVEILFNALMAKQGDLDAALNEGVEEEELQKQNKPTSQAKPMHTVDLTSSDTDESHTVAPKASTTLKKDAKSSKSLSDKWGVKTSASTTTPAVPAKRSAPVDDDDEDASPVKPARKRRLVKGTRPAAPRSSPEVEEVAKPEPPPKVRRKVVVTIDSDDESDAAATPEPESDEEDALQDTDDRILDWLNNCEPKDLADTANQTLDVAEGLLAHRPFASLDAVREVDLNPPPAGKKRGTRKPTGEKVMKVVEAMWESYEAIDELVLECTMKGAPLADGMKQWGVDIFGTSKEVEITNLEELAKNDSGIGTPASTALNDDDRSTQFLQQPSSMMKDLEMKDFQIVGLNWLNLLWSNKKSGILADDMGLGKTCQVISFLTHLLETGETGPHLIIVPGSTLENWLQEIKKFSPKLHERTQHYYGTQKERADIREKYANAPGKISVVVTTYETAVRNAVDNHFLRHLNAGVCVIDEAHYLRNPHAKRYQGLISIPAEMRLLLTGTPLQNNLRELVSLLTFLMPEIFDSQGASLQYIFKNKAKTYDDDHAALLSARRIEKARSMMAPFVLRRKKHQVLKSMPPKICRVEYCELLPAQKRIYDEYLARQQKAWDDKLAGKPRTDSTNVMMKLRQAAIHPLLHRRIYNDEKKLERMAKEYMRKKDPEEKNSYEEVLEDLQYRDDLGIHEACLYNEGIHKHRLKNEEWMDSGKVQKLKELLLEFQKNGDRVLVFSQFTRVMDILEHVLTTLDIQALRMDGSTPIPDRQGLINRFNDDESIPVFMLSTRSGGTGINLAAANKVIIFDSSFNPQDDIQAENRAHRVGQTREVEVIRLVTKDTIEEQIHALGQSKLALDARVAGEMAANGDETDTTVDRTGATLNSCDMYGFAMVENMMQRGVTGLDPQDRDGDVQMTDAMGNEDATECSSLSNGNEGAVESLASTTGNGNAVESPLSVEDQKAEPHQLQDSLKADFKDGLREAGLDVAESQ